MVLYLFVCLYHVSVRWSVCLLCLLFCVSVCSICVHVHQYAFVVLSVSFLLIVSHQTDCWLSNITLTSSHRMPYVHANILPIDNRRTFKHALRFLRVAGSLVNMPHMACHCAAWHVYMQLFLGVHGVTVQWPRTEGTANNERVHSFCLIPLSKTCSFDIHVPAKKLSRRIYVHCHEAFDLSPVCRLFNQALVNNRPLRRTLPTL